MGTTSGAGTAHPSGASEFNSGFSGVRVTHSLALCVCFVDRCLSFCPFSYPTTWDALTSTQHALELASNWIKLFNILKGSSGSMTSVVGLPNKSYKPITNTACVRAWICRLQKGCTRLAAQVIKLTSCLPMVGGSLWVLRLLPPLKLVVIICSPISTKQGKFKRRWSTISPISTKQGKLKQRWSVISPILTKQTRNA